MCVRGQRREVSEILDQRARDRRQPRAKHSHFEHEIPAQQEGHLKAQRGSELLKSVLCPLAEKNLLFFASQKKQGPFRWGSEEEDAFRGWKDFLQHLPTLSTPVIPVELQLYIAISSCAVSAVLIREGTLPVYYVSRILQPVEQRYLPVEKVVLGLVSAARRLRPYFEAHTVRVVSNLTIRQILHHPSLSGRMVKWAIELLDFDMI